jgi:hypothetical protein
MKHVLVALALLAGCGKHGAQLADAMGGGDGQRGDDASTGVTDGAVGLDGHSGAMDAAVDAPLGVVTGGPCLSGATGATLLRITIDDVHDVATVVYDADGTPDHSGYVGIYGYTIPYTPFYDDTFGGGGLDLDSDDFVDFTASTAAITHLTSATLSLYGTTTAGTSGFSWQSTLGYGETSPSYVTNTLPYTWTSVDVTSILAPADAHSWFRIKTLASENGIIVKKIELCVVAT